VQQPAFARQEYETFELLVGTRTATGYPLTITQSAAGEASSLCTLDPARDDLQADLQRIETGDTTDRLLPEFGRRLFDALFPDPIAAVYRSSLGLAWGQGKGLRVRLRLEAPELAVLPWEYLYDGEEDCFLAVSPNTPLVRYVPMPHPNRPTSARPPLRVLVVLSSPMDALSLDVDKEKGLIEQALRANIEQGRVRLQVLERATVAEIGQAMRAFRPHVFHFVGHSEVVEDRASIVLEDGAGQAQLVGVRTFREFFLGIPDTRLAVLNACQLARTSSTQLLAGLAPELLRRNLSAVVAMQSPISDRTAQIFSREFYRSLALGYPVDGALAEARKGILLETGSGAPDWGIPVLYLRAQDGQLFEMAEQEARPEVSPPPEPVQPPLTPGFVGREAELTYFGEELETHHLAVISGMAGVGKTALAAVLTRQIGDPGKTFWHTFHEEGSVEEVIWRLAGFLYWQGRADPWRMLQGVRQSGGQPPPSTVMFDYLRQELQGRGFLLCLDDLDFVKEDPCLAEFLDRLAPALRDGQMRLIVTAQRAPSFVRPSDIRVLAGLSLEDTGQFLAQHGLPVVQIDTGRVYRTHELRQVEKLMAPDVVATLHERTGGNPTLLTLAANALKRTSGPLALLARLASVEEVHIERFLMEEIDRRLGEEERAVMGAVAVLLGHAGTRDAVEAILDGRNVRRTLRGLRERHLLNVIEGEAGCEYSLNTLVRYYFYDSPSRRERQAMHQRAGAHYETEESDPLRAALHYERAGEVARAARLATDDVWASINRGQARPLRDLLERFSDRQLEPELWARVCIARGQVYAFLGEGELAKESFQEALSTLDAQPESPTRRKLGARACRGMGEVLDQEDMEEALRWLRRGLEELASTSPEEEAALHLAAGRVQISLGNYGAALASVQHGLEVLPGRLEQARIKALTSLGTIYSCQGDLETGSAYTRQALELCRRVNNYCEMLGSLMNLAIDKYYYGDWVGAAGDLKQALDLAVRLGNVVEQIRIRNNLGTLQTGLGDHDSALRTVSQAIDAARRWALPHELVWLLYTLAELYIQRRDWEAAQSAALEAKKLSTTLGVRWVLPQIYAVLAQVHLALGSLETALGYAEQSAHLARELEMRIEEGVGQRVLGQSLLAQGRAAEAMQAFEGSLTLLQGETPYEAARTEVQWGLALLRGDEREAGERRLERARATFERLGARHDLAVVEAVVRRET
jgi:ATP/maltotriose-dependent transcriptional regulator MalT